jgi:GH35 family endo-1,4-beta-xylanase
MVKTVLCNLFFLTPVFVCAQLPDTLMLYAPLNNDVQLQSITTLPATLPGENDAEPIGAKKVVLYNNRLDIRAQLGGSLVEKRVAALVFAINSDRVDTIALGISADWWMEVFCNGRSVYSTLAKGNGSNLFSILDHTVALPLRTGENIIAVKVLSGSAGWLLSIGDSSAIAKAEADRKKRIKVFAAKIAQADTRIDSLRKAVLRVLGRRGDTVHIVQQRHHFPFGTAIGNAMVNGHMSDDDNRIYRRTLKENFNFAVHENALKWPHISPKSNRQRRYEDADSIVSWCTQNRIPVRGHCLFWEVEKYVQSWVKKLDTNSLRSAVKQRAFEVVDRYRGRINEYDLNNEMLHGDFYMSRLGIEGIRLMADAARRADPQVRLFVNDFGILTGGDGRRYIRQIDSLQRAGVSIHGIGCQAHFNTYCDAMHVQSTLDSLAETGLPIAITEFDVNKREDETTAAFEQRKADWLRQFYRICFAHPAVESILMWGFWEGAHWIPAAALWKKDWTPTLAAKAYRKLIFDEWWSDTTIVLDTKGRGECRVFKGEYVVRGATGDVKIVVNDNAVVQLLKQ